MAGEQLQVPIETSVVVISVKLKTGETKSQEIQMKHRQGQPVGEIMYSALDIFKRIGGLVEETSDGINFHMSYNFDGPISFAIKKVLLIG